MQDKNVQFVSLFHSSCLVEQETSYERKIDNTQKLDNIQNLVTFFNSSCYATQEESHSGGTSVEFYTNNVTVLSTLMSQW